MKILCVFAFSEDEVFKRLKRKKWQWQFLASGEASETPMNQWNVSFFLGNTKDNQFWALKQQELHGKIVVVAETESTDEIDISNIAQQLLNEYYKWDGLYIDIYHKLGKIPLPASPRDIYKTSA